VASKLAWLARKRGLLLAVAVLVAAVGARTGHHVTPDGFFDGG